MLQISVSSLKEGVKELSKFKAKDKSIYINIYTDNSGVYLTKIYFRKDLKKDAFLYKLNAKKDNENYNFSISSNTLKAFVKIKEEWISFKLSAKSIKIFSEKRGLIFVSENHKFEKIVFAEEKAEKATIKGKELKTLLQTVDYVSKDEANPILQGIHFATNKVYGLDRYRLAIRESSSFNLLNGYTVFNNVLKILRTLLKDDSIVELYFNSTMCKIHLNNLYIYTELMEGKYIDCDKIVPSDFNTEIVLDKNELLEETNFLLSLTKDKPLMCFNITEKGVVIEEKEIENKRKSIVKLNNTEIIQMKNVKIYFNINYIKDMLKHFSTKVDFKIIGPLNPMICSSNDLAGLDLVLSVKVNK